MELIQVLNWEQPIYFATTVSGDSRLNLDPYLSMEGQVLRLYPHKVQPVDKEKIAENFMNNYRFRNLNNPKVYYDPNTQRLMQNYRTAALQSSLDYLNSGDTVMAKKVLQALEEKIPESVIPQYHKEIGLQTGRLYFQLGDTAEYRRRIDAIMGSSDLEERTMMIIIQELVYTLEDYERAEKLLLPMYWRSPDNNWLVGTLIRIYREQEKYQEALGILEDWLRMVPDDTQAQELKTQLQTMANE